MVTAVGAADVVVQLPGHGVVAAPHRTVEVPCGHGCLARHVIRVQIEEERGCGDAVKEG